MFEKEILQAYKLFGIRSFPIDCTAVFRKIGFDIVSYEEAAGGSETVLAELMAVSQDGFILPEESRVLINDRQYVKRQHFTLAHELGHMILATRDEDTADTFASNFLAPRPITFARRLRNADQLARTYGISISAANLALIGPMYVPDEDGMKIIDHFGERSNCPWPFNQPPMPEDIEEIISQEQSFTISSVIITPPVVSRPKEDRSGEIRKLEQKCTRLRRKMMAIDALAPDAEEKYLKYRDQLWEAEKKLDYLTDNIPVFFHGEPDWYEE